MERFGFFFVSDSFQEVGDFTYLHGTLYEHAHECLQVARDWKTSDEKIYFKLLNNSEIIKFAHVKQSEKKFGYLFLSDEYLNNNMLFAHSYSPKLYADILECIFDGKAYHKQSDADYMLQKNTKIGYFCILNDEELVAELHSL